MRIVCQAPSCLDTNLAFFRTRSLLRRVARRLCGVPSGKHFLREVPGFWKLLPRFHSVGLHPHRAGCCTASITEVPAVQNLLLHPYAAPVRDPTLPKYRCLRAQTRGRWHNMAYALHESFADCKWLVLCSVVHCTLPSAVSPPCCVSGSHDGTLPSHMQ